MSVSRSVSNKPKMDLMDIDNPDESNGEAPVGLRLRLVGPYESGEGLPYAPENWPRPGDIWRWKVGPRVAHSGYYLDRYLYSPKRLLSFKSETTRRGGFPSKLAVERYIKTMFPKADIEKFFASFSWKIPFKNKPLTDDEEGSTHDPKFVGSACKAGNMKCKNPVAPEGNPSLATMPCDICCSEPNFCPQCSCILCCKSISVEHGGYNYIRCKAVINEGYICGHVAHVNCALRSYMAGTVGKNIGLDAEYYCRRCDAKTDLVPHSRRFLEICETMDSQEDTEKILNLGVCILQGSQKTSAKDLLNVIQSAIMKLKCGTRLEDIWNEDSTILADVSHEGDGTDHRTLKNSQDIPPIGATPSDHQVEMKKLEGQINQVLQALRKAQEYEYEIAEEKLNTQKKYLSNLYEQLEREKSELSRSTSGMNANDLVTAVLKRSDQIKKEVTKLKEMEEIAKGFGRTPRGILEEHFLLQVEDKVNPVRL